MLKTNYWVKKSNTMNEIRNCKMGLRELRFFSVYLSRINPKDITTRAVNFSLPEFQGIMEISADKKMSKIKADALKESVNSLLSKVVNTPTKTGGLLSFTLFKRCRIEQDEQGEWYIEIDANDDALPYMFEYKDKYFKYQLWNALRLRSVNQLRMYEILKQYEHTGELVISLAELRAELFITPEEYIRFGDFKTDVLEVCKKSLAEQTDIKYTYITHKKGPRGKILELKFTIKKNEEYINQISLNKFIEEQKTEISDPPDKMFDNERKDEKSPYEERINFFMGACDDKFTYKQVVTLDDKMRKHLTDTEFHNQIFCYHYLQNRIHYMLERSEKFQIPNPFGYVKSLVGKEI